MEKEYHQLRRICDFGDEVSRISLECCERNTNLNRSRLRMAEHHYKTAVHNYLNDRMAIHGIVCDGK